MKIINKNIAKFLIFASFFMIPVSVCASQAEVLDEAAINEKIASIGFGKMFVSDPKRI